VAAGPFCSLHHLLMGGFRPTKPDVVFHRVVKEVHILKDHADIFQHAVRSIIPHIFSADPNCPFLHIPKAGNQIAECSLAAAGGPYNRAGGMLRDFHRNIIDYPSIPIFRIEKTRDYTVMSNHHLRDKSLSLKAKGLLSLMLSLPEEWDYTTKGLARICKDGVDSICAGVRELEEHGYVIRQRVRNPNGQLGAIEYTILEQPRPPEPKPQKPERENPVLDNPEQASPVLEEPEQGNPAQLNTNRSSKEKSKKDLSSTEGSNPVLSTPKAPRVSDGMGRDWMQERESYRGLILENIEYDYLIQNHQLDRDRLDELVELMVDTVCSRRETIRIAGDDYPAEVVKSRFLKLDSSHIEYVLDRMRENTTYVRNIKKYLLAALYNAPATIGSYYTSLVSHDLYGGGERR